MMQFLFSIYFIINLYYKLLIQISNHYSLYIIKYFIHRFNSEVFTIKPYYLIPVFDLRQPYFFQRIFNTAGAFYRHIHPDMLLFNPFPSIARDVVYEPQAVGEIVYGFHGEPHVDAGLHDVYAPVAMREYLPLFLFVVDRAMIIKVYFRFFKRV